MSVDVFRLIIDGIHPDLCSAFEELYPNHGETRDRDGLLQCIALAKILKQAWIPEGKVHTNQRDITSSVGKYFVTNSDDYPSQYKWTLHH